MVRPLRRGKSAYGCLIFILLIALPLMGLLIWRLVGRELRFLESAARDVAKRTPESLEPITGEAVPDEIQPLVTALNGLLGRLSGALAQRGRRPMGMPAQG